MNPLDCKELENIVDRWEQGTELSSSEKDSLSSHLRSCAICRKRYGNLLPFLAGPSFPDSNPSGEEWVRMVEKVFPDSVPDIAPSVLERILESEQERTRSPLGGRLLSALLEALSFYRSRNTSGHRRFTPALALGLVVLIGTGFFWGFGLGLFKSSRAPDEVTVRFTLEHVNARSVSLVGDFTDWKAYPLQKVGDRWEIQINLKKGRVYTYNFVLDGEQWVPDPKVPFRVEDGFGGESSLLQL